MKPVKITALLIAGFIVAAPVAISKEGPNGSDDVVELAQKAFDSTRAMTADFTQATESKGFGKKSSASGSVAIKKPGKMRWEYDPPSQLLIVADGKTLWYFDKEEKSIHTQPLSEGSGARSAAMFLAEDKPLAKMFHITRSKADYGKQTIGLRLAPKEPLPGLKAALLKLDAQSFIIKTIIMVDYLGNKNTIEFSGVDVKAAPDPSLFVFTPPEGVKVQPVNTAPGL